MDNEMNPEEVRLRKTYLSFVGWFAHVNKNGRFNGLLTDQDIVRLSPLFELYATDRRVLGTHAQLWSTIRMLSMYSYQHIPFIEVPYLYIRMAWHKICGDEHTSCRIEYARNSYRLRNRPLMLFLSTLKLRYEYLRARLYRYMEYRRISKIYAKQGRIFRTGGE